ncbi:MAG: MliC family protein [Candidatus Paceibacterota bacterium]|jgi:membrane-bound inhibitor of C-type lysozyme
MKIELNKPTWYSKLLALIVFVGTFFLAFYLGQKYEAVNSIAKEYQKQAETITAVFACPEDKAIYAEFTKNQVKLILSDGRKMTLPQTISGSGARFANSDESFIFWNKGDGAFIEENEFTTYQDCLTK